MSHVAPPHPAENDQWPSFFYPPDTDPDAPGAHGKVFATAADVPVGWLIHWNMHGRNLAKEPPDAPVTKMGRDLLRAELKRRDINFPPAAAAAELQKLLDAALADEELDKQV